MPLYKPVENLSLPIGCEGSFKGEGAHAGPQRERGRSTTWGSPLQGQIHPLGQEELMRGPLEDLGACNPEQPSQDAGHDRLIPAGTHSPGTHELCVGCKGR